MDFPDFRRVFFNCSVELRNPSSKYLVDYYQNAVWEASAKSDEQINVIRQLHNSGFPENEDLLFSWLVRYDPLTKSKTKYAGFLLIDVEEKVLHSPYMSRNFQT